MKQNVTLDFSRPDLSDQELAIMPAGLAKRLLKSYARMLTESTSLTIMENQLSSLQEHYDAGKYEEFVKANLEFALERQLIDNISKENWDIYKVEQPTEEPNKELLEP